jgi:hypothetical protein
MEVVAKLSEGSTRPLGIAFVGGMIMLMRAVAMAGVMLAGLAMVPSKASADYLVSVWQNDTPYTVGGSYGWGDGTWRGFTLEPDRSYGTWLHLSNGPRPLFIRFDADPGPGEDYVEYRLRTYDSPTTVFDAGPTEAFIVRPDGRVDLVNVR